MTHHFHFFLRRTDVPPVFDWERDLHELLLSFVYSLVGMLVFAMFFFIVLKFAPFPVIKEIEEDQNSALAILMGAVVAAMGARMLSMLLVDVTPFSFATYFKVAGILLAIVLGSTLMATRDAFRIQAAEVLRE